MNKEQILQELVQLDTIGVSRDKYIITYGAALVLQGVKETTRDVDIYCPNTSIIKFLATKGYESQPFHSGEMVKITSNMDFFTCSISMSSVDTIDIDGFKVQSVQSVRNTKAARRREKDLSDLPMIDEWLATHIDM